MGLSNLVLHLLSAIWIISFVGYGTIITRLFYDKQSNNILLGSIFTTGLLGIAVVSAIATIINIFAPLGQAVSIVIVIVGLILSVIHKRNFAINRPQELFFVVTIFFICMWLSQIGYPTYGGDTFAYHIQIVKWAQESKTAIGIVHLFERLASNNSIFTIAATIELGYFKNYSIFITNGVFLFFIACGFAKSVKDIFTNEQSGSSSLFLFLSGFTIFAGTYKFLGNLYVELSTAVITIAIIYLMLKIIEAKDDSASQKKYFYIIFILSLFAITLKLSMFIFSISSILVSLYLIDKKAKKTIDKIFIIVAVTTLLFPWVLKNILMSGTLLYPVAALRLPFLEWAVSSDECTRVANIIKDWARFGGLLPLSSYQPFSWVEIWFQKVFLRDIDISRSIIIFTLALIIHAYVKLTRKIAVDTKYLYIFIPIGLGLMYWFLTAPDGRFAFALWYSLAFLPLSITLSLITIKNHQIIKKAIALLYIALISITTYNDNIKKIREFPPNIEFPAIAKAKFAIRKSKNGVYYSEPDPDTTCGDAPLPCKEPPPIFIKFNTDFFKNNKLSEPLR